MPPSPKPDIDPALWFFAHGLYVSNEYIGIRPLEPKGFCCRRADLCWISLGKLVNTGLAFLDEYTDGSHRGPSVMRVEPSGPSLHICARGGGLHSEDGTNADYAVLLRLMRQAVQLAHYSQTREQSAPGHTAGIPLGWGPEMIQIGPLLILPGAIRAFGGSSALGRHSVFLFFHQQTHVLEVGSGWGDWRKNPLVAPIATCTGLAPIDLGTGPQRRSRFS